MGSNNTKFKAIPGGAPQQINLDISTMESIKCKECELEEFHTIWILKKVPAVVSPLGKDMIVPLQIFVCSGCGASTGIIHGGK